MLKSNTIVVLFLALLLNSATGICYLDKAAFTLDTSSVEINSLDEVGDNELTDFISSHSRNTTASPSTEIYFTAQSSAAVARATPAKLIRAPPLS